MKLELSRDFFQKVLFTDEATNEASDKATFNSHESVNGHNSQTTCTGIVDC